MIVSGSSYTFLDSRVYTRQQIYSGGNYSKYAYAYRDTFGQGSSTCCVHIARQELQIEVVDLHAHEGTYIDGECSLVHIHKINNLVGQIGDENIMHPVRFPSDR